MKAALRFQRSTVKIEGHPRHAQIIRCSRCNRTQAVVDSTHSGMPDSLVARKFRAKGWHVASHASGDLCPTHNLSPAQKRAAYLRIAGVPKKEQEPKPMNTKPETVTAIIPPAPGGVVVIPPREATIPERRQIVDALDEHYDLDNARYTGSFSDERVAEKLKLPRAWITGLREQLYGPDENEAAVMKSAELQGLKDECVMIEARHLELAEAAETLRKRIEKALAK